VHVYPPPVHARQKGPPLKPTRAPGTIGTVPNKPKPGRRHRSLVFWNGQWWVGQFVTKRMHTSRNAVTEQMWAWYLRLPGAELPERPSPEVIAEGYEQWREETGGAGDTEEPMPEDQRDE
jgi:hypothetical protein